MRSDQETHSVCACGVNAKFITEGHKTGRKRIGPFGDYAFGYNSPWQKMYDLGGKIVMLGVTLVYNTFKHFAEYKLVDDILSAIKDDVIRQTAAEKLITFNNCQGKVWLYHDGLKAQKILTEKGMCRSAVCGKSTFVTVNVREFVDFMYGELLNNPDEWVSEECAAWIKKYRGYIKER